VEVTQVRSLVGPLGALALALLGAGCREQTATPRPSAPSSASAVASANASPRRPATFALRYTTTAGPSPNPRPEPVRELFVGDGWGCAELGAEGPEPSYACWVAPLLDAGPEGPPASGRATLVPWLTVAPVATADRLCAPVGREVKCWPARAFMRERPADLPEPRVWRQRRHAHIWASSNIACVEKEGALACHGDDDFGQVTGSTLRPLDKGWPFPLALGRSHVCARNGLHVECWGRGDHGELGFRSRETCQAGERDVPCSRKPEPVDAPSRDDDGVPLLVAGDLFTCAIWHEFVECWGASRDGFFGKASACSPELKRAWPTLSLPVPAPRAACSSVPVKIPGLRLNGVAHLSAGPRGLCGATFEDGSRCVGAIAAPPRVERVTVSLGDEPGACGIKDKTILCWGHGYSAAGTKAPIRIFVEQPERSDAPVLDHRANWDENCQIRRPCARRTETLKACAPGPAAKPWIEFARTDARQSGHSVRVSGRLAVGPGAGTGAACGKFDPASTRPAPPDEPTPCCDRGDSWAPVVLHSGDDTLRLDGFDCRGDGSRDCCNVAATDQAVIASGTLVWEAERTEPGWILRDPVLCEQRQ
jgi:hypothetical protein